MHILGVKDPNNVDENLTLHELGMDSLIAVEIRQVLERDYDKIMTNEEIRKIKSEGTEGT
jgi:fatty acid synthase